LDKVNEINDRLEKILEPHKKTGWSEIINLFSSGLEVILLSIAEILVILLLAGKFLN
jgi:hypothetical protein